MGTMGLGVTYPDPGRRPTPLESKEILKVALGVGVDFFDTADTYCKDQHDLGYVESILREGGVPGSALVVTKGGMARQGADSSSWRNTRCDQQGLYDCIKRSHHRIMGPDGAPLPLWQLHHPNERATSLEESLRGVVRARDEGWVQRVGLCNVSLDQITRAEEFFAEAVPPIVIASVQGAFSLWDRAPEKSGVLQYCADKSIPFIAYGALGGLKARQKKRDISHSFPGLVRAAEAKGFSVHAVALSLIRHKYPCVVHIVGARCAEHVQDTARAKLVRFKKTEIDGGTGDLWAETPSRARKSKRA